MSANALIILTMLTAAFVFVFIKASGLSSDAKLASDLRSADPFDDEHIAPSHEPNAFSSKGDAVRSNGSLLGIPVAGINPATGLSMVADSSFDVGGNAFGMGSSAGARDEFSMTAMHDSGFASFPAHGAGDL